MIVGCDIMNRTRLHSGDEGKRYERDGNQDTANEWLSYLERL